MVIGYDVGVKVTRCGQGTGMGLATPVIYLLVFEKLHHIKPASINIMAQLPQPPQPDLAELSECFDGAARQISRLQNIPAFNEGRIIINQLQEIAQSICDLGTRLDARLVNSSILSTGHCSTVLI